MKLLEIIKKRFTIQVYNVGLIATDSLLHGLDSGKIRWLRHRYKDRFFADPFLWYQDKTRYYILAEEMCFFEEYGKIVLLAVDKESFSLKERRVVIREPYHLSFPFCKEGGEWITPEAAQSGTCVQYRLDRKGLDILEKRTVSECGIIDPVFLELEGESVLFGSKTEDPKGKLFAYCKGERGIYAPLDLPVREGTDVSRNAGAFFTFQGKMIRPVQDCTDRYGSAVVLMQVEDPTPESYSEIPIARIDARHNPPYHETLHTLNVYGKIALVDGSFDCFSLRNIVLRAIKLFRRGLRGRKEQAH